MQTLLPDAVSHLADVYPREGIYDIKMNREREIKLTKHLQVFTLMRASQNFSDHDIFAAHEVQGRLYKLAQEIDAHMADMFPNSTIRYE